MSKKTKQWSQNTKKPANKCRFWASQQHKPASKHWIKCIFGQIFPVCHGYVLQRPHIALCE